MDSRVSEEYNSDVSAVSVFNVKDRYSVLHQSMMKL
jgi:hypothetical protein